MADLDLRPPAVNVRYRTSDTLTVTFLWPTGTLVGRSFTAHLDDVALTVMVAADVMTATATAAQTLAGYHAFRLTETTSGKSDEVIIGTWVGDVDASASTHSTVTVTTGLGQVTVNVDGSAALLIHEADDTAHGNPLGALATHEASTTAHGNPLGALATHEADLAAHGNPLGALATHEADLTAHGDPLGALATHEGDDQAHGDPLGALSAYELAQARAMDPNRPNQALAQYRADVARTRSGTAGDTDARSTTVVIGPGDSLSEAFTPTKRGLMWTRHLARRLNGARMGGAQYIPASAGTFSQITPASVWPGSQPAWTYTGTVTGLVTHGGDLHAVTLAAGATATLQWVGEVIGVVFTQTPSGPAAAAVTLDGISQTAIDAQGSELVGQQAVYSATGYGPHTLVVTATGAPMILEGATVHDNEIFGFGVPCRVVRTMAFGHAGFATNDFITRPNWAPSIANMTVNAVLGTYPALFISSLGANDIVGGVPAATYRTRYGTVLGMMEDALEANNVSTDPGWLLVAWPGFTDAYVDAMWDVAADHDPARVGVLDLRAYLPGGELGVMAAGDLHPNDAGQLWVANVIADYIDGANLVTAPAPAVGPASNADVIIEATTPPTFRSAWAESLALAQGFTYDTTSADNTVRERRHRVWLERGTYQARLRYGELTTTGGQAEVLVGANSLGTASTTGTTGNIGHATLGTQVIIDSPGAYPVTIRKTGANSAALRFSQLYLRKTA